MMYNVTLIHGDGIGFEVVEAARKVVEATGVDINWELAKAGQCAIPEYSTVVPKETIELIKKNKVALKGPLTNIVGAGFKSPNITLRNELDLYANIRHAKYFEGSPSKWTCIDFITVRETMEDVYAGAEQMVGSDAAVAFKFITRKGSERVIRKAFEYARKENRKKLTVSVKANILKLTDGLFLKAAKDVSKDYPDIEYDETIIDALCMHLVKDPQNYDVIVTENCYGDLISDLTAGLAGGLGLGYGVNLGDEIAVFEATHGSAPKYEGLNKVNPTALILSGALMLRHLGEKERAIRIEDAVKAVISEGKSVTYDLGGEAGTKEMTEAIIAKL